MSLLERCTWNEGDLEFLQTQDAEWEESEHPRVPAGQPGAGQFGSGGGHAETGAEYFQQNWHKAGSVGGHSQPTPGQVAAYTAAYQQTGGKPPGGLDLGAATKVGEKMGSNPGGTYEVGGQKYYVKEGKSEAHVRNEMTAVALYQLAGARTLDYIPVQGGKHIASRLESLDKSNAKQFSPEEIRAAQRDFAVHAWTANWDAVGLDHDNLGTKDGKIVNLDLGGALEYRAQGGPKGNLFGTNVGEWDTLRNGQNKQAASVFGGMSSDDLIKSAYRVTSLDDQQIRDAVAKGGGSKELADKLIARRDDIQARVNQLMAKEAGYGSSEKPLTGPKPTFGGKQQLSEKTAAQQKETAAGILAGTQKLQGNLAERVALRKELKGKYGAEAKDIQGKILASLKIQHDRYVAKGKFDKAEEVKANADNAASKYGLPNPITGPKTMAEANAGFTEAEKAGAKEVMAENAVAGKTYTPEETKSFNDLVKAVGLQSAKSYTNQGKKLAASNPHISGAEAAHIAAYTGHAYGAINTALWTDSVKESQWGHINALNAALDKLPNYEKQVYRTANFSSKDIAQFFVGNEVELKGFSSASKHGFIFGKEYKLKILSKYGKDIQSLSLHKSENEVLFKSGSRFRVTHREGKNITLEQF